MKSEFIENDSTQKAHIAKANTDKCYATMERRPNINAIRILRTKPYDIEGCDTLPIKAKRNK